MEVAWKLDDMPPVESLEDMKEVEKVFKLIFEYCRDQLSVGNAMLET